MTKRQPIGRIMILFSLVTGFVIGALVWLYLKASNVGITLVWDKIGSHFPTAVYTLIVCLIGGVIIGLFHRKYGPIPENMSDAVRHAVNDRSYPYRQIPIVIIAALLSLLFGGAIGPESGLVCLLLSLCFWAKDQFGMARYNVQNFYDCEPQVSGRLVLKNLLANLFTHPLRIAYTPGKVQWSRKMQIACGVAAGLGGLLVYYLLGLILGRAFTLPRIDGGTVYNKDRLFMILLLVVGIAAGYLYLILKKVISTFFKKLRDHNLHILNAILGGLILGLIGGQIPLVMFSGCTDIQTIQGGYMNSVPYMLIVVGVLKLFLTNVCIESGWRGGHFFPLLFSGFSIGFGFAEVLGTNEILSVVVVTGALLGIVLQQPLGALALSVIFFPLRAFGWMVLASFVGGCIPLPAAIRVNPDNRGFIPGMVDRIGQRRAANENNIEDDGV